VYQTLPFESTSLSWGTVSFRGSDVTVDKKDRVWFSVTSDKVPGNFGVPGRFDPKTGQWTPVPIEGEPFFSQFSALAPDGSIVQGGLNIDADSMKLLERFDYMKAPNAPPGMHFVYEPAMDSKGNWYGTDFGASYIVQIEAKTKKVNWFKTPTAFSQPRRGRIDNQDRFWFGMYTADKIGMFDPKTSKITEFDTGMKWSAPYTASIPDAKGRVYSPSNSSDRVFQLDPKTGEVVAFLMPTKDFDSKQLSIDPVGKKTIWLANVRNARIMKIEPLD
jgi:streptogramin lyase